MWSDFAIEGWKVGMIIALPLGPTVILLLRIGLLCGWRAFGLSAFGAALGIAMVLALTCVAYIQTLLDRHPVLVHGILSIMVLVVAWNVFRSNRSITAESLHKRDTPINIWAPPIISLTCPFTSILILNIFATNTTIRQSMSLSIKGVLIVGCVVGALCGYGTIMSVVYGLSRKLSRQVVLIMVKIAPLIVMYYGIQGAWAAYRAW